MDHADAVRLNATERYLLKELDAAQLDQFDSSRRTVTVGWCFPVVQHVIWLPFGDHWTDSPAETGSEWASTDYPRRELWAGAALRERPIFFTVIKSE